MINELQTPLLDSFASPELVWRFTLGFIVGAGVVWSSVVRTLAVNDASYRDALIGSLVNSVAYYYSIHFIAKDDTVAYVGTALGSTLIILYMVMKNKRGKQEWVNKARQKKTRP